MSEATPANHCFGCGEANPHGMKLAFERDAAKRRVRGKFRIEQKYQGGLGMLHGGIIALILDEAMGKVCRFSDVRAVTASLSVEFKKPIRVEEEISVEAFEDGRDGRSFHVVGEIRRSDGELLARGRGRFVAIQPETYTI
jgi:acyl-coenzyme A thioesterase PaaI-like protein